MTDHVAQARAVFTLGTARDTGVVVVAEWPPRSRSADDRLWLGGLAMGYEYLAADATGSDPGWREIADVIICDRSRQQREISAWLLRALGRYPGCALAAAGLSPGACAVATRCGTVASFIVQGLHAEPGLCAFVCGSFVHGWLCSNRPLSALGPATLRVAAGREWVGWDSLVQGSVLSYSLCITDASSSD